MLKLLIKTLGFIACFTLSGVACAVGMGGINVVSALGEPLKAEIELVAVGKSEKNSLSAHLASPDVFRGAGIDFPSTLPKLKFQIEARDNGDHYIKMTSLQPVNEPFVSLLVELNWSSGRLLREYTFLLDPPGYRPEQPKTAEVKPVLSKVETPVEPSRPERIVPAPASEKMPVATPTAARKHAESNNVATGDIKVKRGDTLNKIAREIRPSDISLERMLVALYRANTDAFDGNNMNRLKAGKILRMPEQSDLSKLAQVDAVKEIRAQVADWHAYRQKLAAASTAITERARKQETSGKISATVAEKTPAAKEPAKEVVRLSKGEAPGDKTAVVGGNAKTKQEKANAVAEEAIAKKKALKESNERIALLEKNAKDMQRLIELKGKTPPPPAKPEPKIEPAKAVAQPPVPVAASSVAAAASGVAAASAVKPAKPTAKPMAAPKVAPPPPSLLDDPLYMVGGAAALLALGGLGFVLAKRRRGGKADDKKKPDSNIIKKEDAGSKTSTRISTPIAPSPESGDFTHIAAGPTASQAPSEDVDPISEADLFLNFGRDAQAEDILKDALEKNPANNQIRLKLLSIYANRKDTKQFSSIARQIKDSGDEVAWAQAAEMGRGMEPNNPMYGGASEPVEAAAEQVKSEQQPAAGLDFDLGFVAPETAATFESEGTLVLDAPLVNSPVSTGLDFDLGLPEPEAAPANEGAAVPGAEPLQEAVMDFDITSTHPSMPTAEPEQAAVMDFDITSTHMPMSAEPEQAASTGPSLDDLVFDVTSSHPVFTEAPKEEAVAAAPDNGGAMEFTLDIPVADKPDTAPVQVAATEEAHDDIGLSGISLNFDEPVITAPVPAETAKDAHWHEVATKLDLAKAYQEMGDNAGAREILEEVLAEGDEQQRAAAEAVLQQLLA